MILYVNRFFVKIMLCMSQLIQIIDNITRYGLKPKINTVNKKQDLEKHLILLFAYKYSLEYEFDDSDYPDFNKPKYSDLSTNIKNNFPDFGSYHAVLNGYDVTKEAALYTGNPIDDLSIIIAELFELKWRMENNSEADGYWYLELLLNTHLRHRVIDLLSYLKSREK